MKSRTDAGFRATGDEELDIGDLVHIVGKYRKNGRGGFFILALVEGVDDDES